MHKKIIAIEPLRAEKTSATVKSNANKVIKWQTSFIMTAIKEQPMLCKLMATIE